MHLSRDLLAEEGEMMDWQVEELELADCSNAEDYEDELIGSAILDSYVSLNEPVMV